MEQNGGETPTRGTNDSSHEILIELRGLKRDLSSLKDEVRENSVSASDLKKLKTEKDINWRFEGNRLQYEFNSAIDDNLKQLDWSVKNNKLEYASELLSEVREKLRVRNKHIRIADGSEGGWTTVREYESHPLASDTEDESRLTKAESRAIKKRKNKSIKKKKSKPAVAYGYSDSTGSSIVLGSQVTGTGHPFLLQSTQQYGGKPYSFRGSYGPCFACGEANHIRRNCPYTNRSSQPELPARK
ncbi:uncharacterized protein LOC128225828 [Mya arenaria]|uniref:uncharacterized protein LOC128225828 n=1 Tax=Mya arenaria TaxID=6604 RepID=UPI0022E5BD92|nr:uncharacterized protein LOC128225828 [Mya arenaria]